MKTLALLAVLLVADTSSQPPSRIIDTPVLPPRDPHPFGAIETRPLWERPRREPLTLQEQAEDALDRGTGRIEDDASFELRLREHDRDSVDAGADAIGRDNADALDLRDRRRARAAYERFRLEQDRRERLEDRRMRLEREGWRQQRLERESEALADVRRRFAAEANRPNQALGAVVDRQGLAAVEGEYRAALDAASKQHQSALSTIDADKTLAPDARAARRAAADAQLDQARAAAARRWEERRRQVLGQK